MAKKFKDKRGEYQDFPSKKFCLTVPKIFGAEPSVLCFRKFLVAKKFMDKGGGEYQVFPSEMFRLAVPKNFVVESFPVEIFSGTEKLWIKGGAGVSRFAVESFLSHSAEKLRRRTLWCFRKYLVSKNFMLKGLMSRFPVENFLSHSVEIFRRGILYCCSNFGYRKCLDKMGGGGEIKIFR